EKKGQNGNKNESKKVDKNQNGKEYDKKKTSKDQSQIDENDTEEDSAFVDLEEENDTEEDEVIGDDAKEDDDDFPSGLFQIVGKHNKKEHSELNPLYETVHGLSKASRDETLNYIQALCYGAAAGDAIGNCFKNNSKSIAQAIKMKAPRRGNQGQVTDDTEMALCITRGLLKMIQQNKKQNRPNVVTMKYIVKEYQRWLKSNPLDAGQLIKMTLKTSNASKKSEDTVMEVRKRALEENDRLIKEGESGVATNGNFEFNAIESSLTHASDTVYYSLAAYALAAQYLIRFPAKANKHKLAVKHVLKYLEAEKQKVRTAAKSSNTKPSAISTVIKWITQARDVATPNSKSDHKSLTSEFMKLRLNSHIRISLQYAFYHLYKQSPFDIAIKETLHIQGNPDSNCCVVGGLMGAYHGMKVLENFKKKLNEWKYSNGNKNRSRYHAKHYKKYLPLLFKYALKPQTCKVDETDGNCTDDDEFVL
ncbi:ADP-ribosylglycohydrolase family protein, partial [Reticulomyxa filosa]